MKTLTIHVSTVVALGLLVCQTACFSTVKSDVVVDDARIDALTAFDYSDWTQITTTLVDDQGRVNYAALKADRTGLDRFVATLAVVGPKTRPELFPQREDKLAYYINAYNALTMFNVINRLPALTSVNDDAKDFFYFTEFQLDGEAISLYNLENEVVRPTFDEPRAHFALNCASAGCPQLPAEPFLPATLEAQLARETAKFLHETRNVKLDGDAVVLSQIFEWYAADFRPSPVAWIRAQAPDLNLPAGAKVRHTPYDWALNVQPGAR